MMQYNSVPNPPSRNLFIAGFKSDMTDAALRRLFEPFGPIESAKVMLDIHTGFSRGFAFVLYHNLHDAVNAREALNETVQSLATEGSPTTIADQFKLIVEFAKHDAYNVVTKNVKVYCRNIPTTVNETTVATLMEEWVGEHTVVTVSIMPDSSRSPAFFAPRASTQGGPCPSKPAGNVAFIEFKTADDAERAVELTYKKRIEGPGSVGPLMTKFAETAEVRSERKKRQPTPTAPPALFGATPAPPHPFVIHQPPPPPLAAAAGAPQVFPFAQGQFFVPLMSAPMLPIMVTGPPGSNSLTPVSQVPQTPPHGGGVVVNTSFFPGQGSPAALPPSAPLSRQ